MISKSGLQPQHLFNLVQRTRICRMPYSVFRCKLRKTGPFSALSFKNFGDGLLDYIEAGPKLRKWYGEGERRPRNDQEPEPEEEKPESQGDAILVTDADSSTGELVVLQLILQRQKIVALVRDPVATSNAYGEYVTPIRGGVGNSESLLQAMKQAKSIICPTHAGLLPEALRQLTLGHVVLLSSVGSDEGSGFLGKLLGSESAVLADPAREESLRSCNTPLTIVRVGKLADAPGGTSELRLLQGGDAPQGTLSREDAAKLLVQALQRPPKVELCFSVSCNPCPQPLQILEGLFASLQETPPDLR